MCLRVVVNCLELDHSRWPNGDINFHCMERKKRHRVHRYNILPKKLLEKEDLGYAIFM